MKKLLLALLVFIATAWPVFAANVTIVDLAADGTPTTDDLVETVDDPGGTPASKKATIGNVLGTMPTSLRLLTDPGGDRLLFWDDSETNVAWLTIGTGLSLTGTTLTATGSGDMLKSTYDAGDDGLIDMAAGGLGVALSDPNADRILFWDDSAGAYAYLTIGSGLSITATTITATGSGDVTAVGPGYASGAAFTDGVVSTGTAMLIWEGTTDDTNEITIAIAEDPGADVTITIPSETGTIVVGPAGFAADNILVKTDGTGNLTQATGITVDDSNNVSGVGTIGSGAITSSGAVKGTSIVLEGGDYDTTIQAGTPAAAITYTMPSNTGTEGQYMQLGASNTLQWGDPAGSGDITAIGNFDSGAAFTTGDTQNGILYFEGATANDFEIALTAANATADRTITLPDETGTVMLGPAGLGTDNRLMKTDGTGNVVQITGITVDDSNNVSGLGTLGLTGAVTISANSAAITHSGTTTLAIASTSGTVSVESVTFTGDAITGAASLAASSYIALGADPADAGSIRLPNAGYVYAEADATGTDISVIGVDSSEVIQIGASGASGVTITPATTITGHVTLEGVTSTGATGTGKLVFDTAPVFTTSAEVPFLIIGSAATAADAGAIRLPNAAYIYAEADAAGTDISVIGVDSSEVVQIAASGASGVTITPDTTITGALTVNGSLTSGNADTDVLTIRSRVIGGNSRAVWIDDDETTSPSYATGTNELFVEGDIETSGTVYAAAVSTGTGTDGQRRIDFTSNTTFTPSGNQMYFLNNVGKISENGTERDIVTPADSVTWTGTSHSFVGVTNLLLPTAAPDANGEVAINNTSEQFQLYVNSGLKTFDFSSDSAGYVWKSDGSGNSYLAADETAGSPTLNSVGDPTADTTITFDAAEQLVWDFSGAYSTGTQFLIQQTGSSPTGGVLFEVNAADSQVTAARIGDGTNYSQFSSVGGLTLAGTATITAGGLVLGDASPDASGEIGYASNAFNWFANSEDMVWTAGTNTWTFSSNTGAALVLGSPSLTGATVSGDAATITHSGATSLTIASTSGTVVVEGVTFTGDAVTGVSSLTVGALAGVNSIDATGAVDMDYGSADVTDHTFVSDGGTVIIDGSVTAATSFIIGGADLNETDLEKLDGITNGTQAANKAVVADANVNTGVSKVTELHIGASGSEVQVTATPAELNYLDITTLGTGAASKAVVLDGSGNYTAPAGVWNLGGATSFEIPNSDDPDTSVTGQVSFDTDGWLRVYNNSRQEALARVQEEIHVTVVKPQDMADAVRDAFLVWSNESGMTFTVTGWKCWAGADDTSLNIETTAADGSSNATVDAVECATGSGPYTGADTTITAATIANGSLIWLDFDDTDDPSYVKLVIYGYYGADVN